MRRPSPRRRRRSFTLIELLVVVAIIAILAAMLLPALTRARETSKRAACSANVKQLTMSFTQYTEDMVEFPPSAFGTQHPSYWCSSTWYGNPLMIGFGQLIPGYANADIFICPGTPLPRGTSAFSGVPSQPYYNTSYWYYGLCYDRTRYGTVYGGASVSQNQVDMSPHWATFLSPERKLTWGGWSSFVVADVRSPEKEVLLADCTYTNFDGEAGLCMKANNGHRLGAIYPDGTNVGCLDGHVSFRSYRAAYWGANVRPGTDDVNVFHRTGTYRTTESCGYCAAGDAP